MSKKKNSKKNDVQSGAENEKKLTLEKADETPETDESAENAPETVETAADDVQEETASAIDENADEENAADSADDDTVDDGDGDNDDTDDDDETDEDDDSDDDDDDDGEEAPKEKKPVTDKDLKKAEKKSRRSFKARAFKRGWFSAALVTLFVAAVVVVNMLASVLVERVPALVADTTGSGSFKLTDETVEYLEKLNQEIKIIVLCDEKTYREGGEYYIQADSLLHKYEDNSDKITLQFLDLASNPTFTSQYPDEQLAQYSIIVQGENDYKYLTTMEYFDVQIDYSSYSYYIAGCKVEEAVTSAILNVTLDNKPKVSFISGITNEDYSAFVTYLQNNGFETQEISPAIDEIPSDTEILVLYAPNVDLDSTYVDIISTFLNNGGNYGKQLLYLPSASLAPRPNIDSLLEEWGVQVENGYAIENDMTKVSQITYGVYLLATEYTDTTYTEKMKNPSLPFCVFYGNGVYTHPINILDESKAKSLMKLSDQSSVIYPPDTADNAEPVEESKPGLAVGVIASKGSTKTDTDSDAAADATVSNDSNIVVIGSNFAVTESFLSSGMYGNASYMSSLLNTLAGRDNVSVTIETQSLKAPALDISTAQLRVLTVLYAVVLPLAVLIAGIVIFIKRRNM